jgi:hypothetical protein
VSDRESARLARSYRTSYRTELRSESFRGVMFKAQRADPRLRGSAVTSVSGECRQASPSSRGLAATRVPSALPETLHGALQIERLQRSPSCWVSELGGEAPSPTPGTRWLQSYRVGHDSETLREMAQIKKLAELTTRDERALRFTSLGFRTGGTIGIAALPSPALATP